MTKRRIILVSVVCFSLTVFTVQTLPRTPSSSRPKPPDTERLWNMTEEEREKEFAKRVEQWKLYLERSRNMAAEERKREFAKRREQVKLYSERLRNMTEEERKWEAVKWRRQWELESEQKRKESRKRSAERRRQMEPVREQRKLEREQRRKEWEKEKAEGFMHEKYALGVTEQQWKVIKPKLEKVQNLRRRVSISMRAGWGPRRLPGSTGPKYMDPRYLHEWSWRWFRPSAGKAPDELTEGQRIVEELIDLVESKNATAEEFKRKMDASRESKSRQEAEKKEKKKELLEALQELREVLTTRQEAALVLMGRL